MRTATLTLIAGGIVALASLTPTQAHATSVPIPPGLVAQVSEPALQPVWYDRWGRWHPPHYYGYGPPPRYWYWRHRRWECVRWGRC